MNPRFLIIRAVDRLILEIFQNEMVFFLQSCTLGGDNIIVYNHNEMPRNYI